MQRKRKRNDSLVFGLDLLYRMAVDSFRYWIFFSAAEWWIMNEHAHSTQKSSSHHHWKSFRVCGNEFIDTQTQLEFGKFVKCALEIGQAKKLTFCRSHNRLEKKL